MIARRNELVAKDCREINTLIADIKAPDEVASVLEKLDRLPENVKTVYLEELNKLSEQLRINKRILNELEIRIAQQTSYFKRKDRENTQYQIDRQMQMRIDIIHETLNNLKNRIEECGYYF